MTTIENLPRLTFGTMAAALAVVCTPTPADDDDSDRHSKRLEIRTLSTPADRVSGGNALVELANVRHATRLEVRLNGRDTHVFRPGNNPGTLLGLVNGLQLLL